MIQNCIVFIKGCAKRGLLKLEDGRFDVEAALYSIVDFDPVLKDHGAEEFVAKWWGRL